MLTVSGVLYILMSLLPLLYREKKPKPEQYVLNPTPKVKLVSQEVSTQTDSAYYSHIYQQSPPPPPQYYDKVDTVALPP